MVNGISGSDGTKNFQTTAQLAARAKQLAFKSPNSPNRNVFDKTADVIVNFHVMKAKAYYAAKGVFESALAFLVGGLATFGLLRATNALMNDKTSINEAITKPLWDTAVKTTKAVASTVWNLPSITLGQIASAPFKGIAKMAKYVFKPGVATGVVSSLGAIGLGFYKMFRTHLDYNQEIARIHMRYYGSPYDSHVEE